MRIYSTFVCVVAGMCATFAAAQADPQPVTVSLSDECVEVRVAGELFTRYKVDGEPFTYESSKSYSTYRLEDSPKYPYFWPVNGPASGESITSELAEPYPHHHSLFFGCDKVNGGNYWQEVNARGRIASQGPKIPEAAGERVVIADECLWQRPDEPPIMRDSRRIVITAPDATLRFIDFTITLEPLVDVTILKSNHALFSARVCPELSVKGGGKLVNANGDTGEETTWGVASPWCDYSGTWDDGITEGIAIFQHPDNRWYPCKWFTRNYGFFSPTPMQWLEGGKLELPEGEELTLSYRVVVHAGDAETADIAGLYDAYLEGKD